MKQWTSDGKWAQIAPMPTYDRLQDVDVPERGDTHTTCIQYVWSIGAIGGRQKLRDTIWVSQERSSNPLRVQSVNTQIGF